MYRITGSGRFIFSDIPEREKKGSGVSRTGSSYEE
jgi:hypothetical protein